MARDDKSFFFGITTFALFVGVAIGYVGGVKAFEGVHFENGATALTVNTADRLLAGADPMINVTSKAFSNPDTGLPNTLIRIHDRNHGATCYLIETRSGGPSNFHCVK